MTSLVKQDEFTLALQDVEQTQAICERLIQHKHYQKLGPEGIYAIVAKAKILGIHPLEALNGGIYFVQGKTGMSSEMMASLIRQAGHSIMKDPKSDNSVCILHGKRKDNGDTWTCSFSMDDAKRAGLAKNMYEKYPGIMIYNRCLSMLARQLFPDIIKGAGYCLDELREISRVDEVKVDPAEITVKTEEVKKPTDEEFQELAEVLAECDPEFVKAKLEGIKKLPGVKDLYNINLTTYTWLLDLAKKNREKYIERLKDNEELPDEACE